MCGLKLRIKMAQKQRFSFKEEVNNTFLWKYFKAALHNLFAFAVYNNERT